MTEAADSSSKSFLRYAAMAPERWRDDIIKSVSEPVIDGLAFPRFPEEGLQRRTVGNSYEQAIREAFQFYTVVRGIVLRNRLSMDQMHMVDFGACWGRISRFFLRDVPAENIIGLESWDEFVEVAQTLSLPFAIRKVDQRGPSGLAPNSCELVVAFSVWSHLTEEFANLWMDEFSKVVRPGGLIIATTWGEGMFDMCERIEETPSPRSAWHENLIRSFPQSRRQDLRRAYQQGEFIGTEPYRPGYGEALIPPGYMTSRWGDRFELIEFREMGQGLNQSLFALKRRASAS